MSSASADDVLLGDRLPGPSGRIRSTGLMISVALHLLALALLFLRPELSQVPTAVPQIVTLLPLAPRPAQPALPPSPPAAPELTPPKPKPRKARSTVKKSTPITPPPEAPAQVQALTQPDPPPAAPAASTAPSAPAVASAAGNAAAASAGPGRPERPGCMPIPYGWLAKVAQTISTEQRYPAISRQLGERGTAYVRLNLDRTGALLEAPLVRSSGHAHLDDEARDVMRRIGNFGRVPDSACPGQRVIVIDQPVSFAGG